MSDAKPGCYESMVIVPNIVEQAEARALARANTLEAVRKTAAAVAMLRELQDGALKPHFDQAHTKCNGKSPDHCLLCATNKHAGDLADKLEECVPSALFDGRSSCDECARQANAIYAPWSKHFALWKLREADCDSVECSFCGISRGDSAPERVCDRSCYNCYECTGDD